MKDTPILIYNTNRTTAKHSGFLHKPTRHNTVSQKQIMGFSLKDIQEWLGHADITMTGNVYGHLFNDRKVALAQQLADKMSAVNG